ncbi:hypothetical protein DL767_001236 [Monosporascus sp. MG133]|nr:hypothetical protein DL767_001236 [Monosporascus sp. MG133]
MPASQPWKIFWPPAEVNKEGTSHGCPAGSTLWSMGSSVANPQDKEVKSDERRPIEPQPTNSETSPSA